MKKLSLFLLLLSCCAASAATRYVDNAATGANDGSSWLNAWTNLLFLDRSSNKVAYGDTIYVASRIYTEMGDIRLKEGNVSGGTTNWTHYYFTDGPVTIRTRLMLYAYTELNGGADHNYATNIIGTYGVANITNNINLHIDRSTNYYGNGSQGRSIIGQATPVKILWVRCTGAHRIDSPKSDAVNEIFIGNGSGDHGNSEIGYCWVDGCGGFGSSASISCTSGNAVYAFGKWHIHHCIIENLETDIFSTSGGADIDHCICRNRYGNCGACNDSFILAGSACYIRVWNNLIEPSDNALYYWPSTSLNTNLHDFYFYGNLLRPVDPTNYYHDITMASVGSPDMRCDNGSLTGTITISSNIVFAHNTVIGKHVGGPLKLISIGIPQAVQCSYSVSPGAYLIENNLLANIDTAAAPVYTPIDFYAYNTITGHNTNSLGYTWVYPDSGVLVDYNLFHSYLAGNLNALAWGSGPTNPLTTMVDAAAINSFLHYSHNQASTNTTLFPNYQAYDYRPTNSAVNFGTDMSSWTNLMPDITTDLYGNYRTNWSVGAIEYQGAIPPSAPSILLQPSDYTVLAGTNVTFTFLTSGTLPISYTWFRRQDGITTSLCAGTIACSNSLALTAVTTNSMGDYQAIATNLYGAVTSRWSTLTVTNNMAPPPPPPGTNGLLCWLTFEGNFPAQNYAEDYSGNGAQMLNYGWGSTATNFPTISAGKVGAQSASFLPYTNSHPYSVTNYWDGQYGAITNLGAMNQLTQATFALWSKFTDVGTGGGSYNHTGTFLDTGYGERGDWHFGRYYSDPYGEPYFMVMTNTSGIGDSWQLDFPHPATYDFYTNSTWWHFAVTVDCSNSNLLRAVLYTNGVVHLSSSLALDAAHAVPYLRAHDPAGAQWGPWIAVGCWTHNGTPPLDDADELPNNGWLNGALDDVRIYNRILSAAEIRTLANPAGLSHAFHNVNTRLLKTK